MGIQCGSDVAVVGLGRLAFDREHRNAPVLNKRRRNVILGGKGIRGNQNRVGAASLQCTSEVSSLCCDMGTSNEFHTIQWFLFGEAFSDEPENWHFAFSPLNPLLAVTCQAYIFHVVIKRTCSAHFLLVL